MNHIALPPLPSAPTIRVTAEAVRPLFGNVLARRLPAATSTGRILLPDAASHPPAEAVVLAVGTGAVQRDGRLKPLPFQIGDHVLVAKYGGIQINADDPLLLILRSEDILGIVRDTHSDAQELTQTTSA